MRRLLLDLTPLRESPAYRRMWLGTSLSGIGTQLTTMAVMLQVYSLGGSTLSVGVVGACAVVPLVLLGLYGGSIVDAHDRRRVVLLTQVGLFGVAVVFAAISFLGLAQLWMLYGLVALQSGLFAINSPARTAIIPRLLPPALLPAANALNSLSFGVAMAAGPLLAGVLVEAVGYGWAYSVEAVLLVVAIGTLSTLPALPPEGVVRRSGLRSVVEGLQFLGTRPNLRMTFAVDLCAMVLAMPRVLFPAIGSRVLGGGAFTAGLLVAGIAVGTFFGGLLSGPLGRVRKQGEVIVVAVIGWGVAIAAFGIVVALSPGPRPGGGANWLVWPAVACLVAAGVADTISAIFRSTILQAATPDALRGRLQGVFIVVVAGGPQLGTLLLGSTASVTGEAMAAVLGGVACVVAVVLLAANQRGFLRYDALHPVP